MPVAPAFLAIRPTFRHSHPSPSHALGWLAFSVSELAAADLPERPALLDPILSSNDPALLYGPRGLAKSFLARGIARGGVRQ
jgi:hypothetical protein